MKRSLPALKLTKSPLVVVLAQVRIAPIVKMGDFIPDIQERLRRLGLPRYLAGEDIQVQVAQSPVVQRVPRWEFQSKDQTRSVVVTQDFIAAQTSSYSAYEEFEAFFSEPLCILGEVAEPSLVQRVGLRYVDLIRPGPHQTPATFLNPGLLGLSAADVGARELLARYEHLARTEVGTMRVRCLQANDGSPLPPDLRNSTLRLDSTVAKGLAPGEVVTILDLDHFNTEPSDYEDALLLASIADLHDNLDRAFRAVVTEAALAEWGAELP